MDILNCLTSQIDDQNFKNRFLEHIKKGNNLDLLETQIKLYIENQNRLKYSTGGRRNKTNEKDMKMDDIKKLCKNNEIKLSKTVNDKRIIYTKKELITKLRKKNIL
jgi:hypothetical protein